MPIKFSTTPYKCSVGKKKKKKKLIAKSFVGSFHNDLQFQTTWATNDMVHYPVGALEVYEWVQIVMKQCNIGVTKL